MGYSIASPELLEKMRIAGRLAANTLTMIGEYVKPGMTTNELNDRCHEFMVSAGAKPAPLGYHGFPKSICTSPNHVICHGIPNEKPLKNGDILNIDVSLSLEGAYADTCKMYFVGEPTVMGKRIVQCAREALYAGIAAVAVDASLRRIGQAIQRVTQKYGYSIVRDFCGHGIGTQLHSDPQILHYDAPQSDSSRFQSGMTFTIEPMINVGKHAMRVLPDGWTAVTRDHSLSAQYEHTMVVTEAGVEILTLREEEKLSDIFPAC
ncbi:MAG: type I methionyl aminopeptidase [Gammaproteobacteria bacterium RIFCSPHIGHO2_12_FULL_45_9]|nr:MAG: type I methionyl aminopeptidase [Gammaproteobacteria bacterium RIFCSPHIGHO2_12_FULL_45_9]